MPIPNIKFGRYLKHELKYPFSASRNLVMRLIGRDYQIWDGNLCVAFTYCDKAKNQGIVVLDEKYDGKAYELAKKFESAHPESKVEVIFKAR